jgi:lysophospholipase L1-like esterase
MLQGMAPQQEPVGARSILLLVVDSDIARWPSELLPQWSESALPPTVSGHSGATLKEIIPHIETALDTIDTASDTIVLVICAGENDIGNGLSRDGTLTAFDELLSAFFGNTKSTAGTNRRLIFLGPKLEPWLNNDESSRKQYVKLSRAFQRSCAKHARADETHFVDCLTMFCGKSANVPGATLGGKAKAEPMYFSSDQLHLSEEGYRIWKQVVEERLSELSI